MTTFIRRLLSSKKTKHDPNVPATSKSDEFVYIFRCFDENGDGKISPGELRGCMRAYNLSLEQAEAVVKSADSDGDGLLGFEDFVALVDVDEEEERVKSLREAFEVYRVSERECIITAESLRKALRLLGESRSVEECREMIRKFDVDGDGVISFEEFREMML